MLNDLTTSQKALAEYMSALSEHAYRAGWMRGLEFALWHATAHGPFQYGALQLTQEHVRRLDELSTRCGGWISFDEVREEVFVTLEEWALLAASNAEQKGSCR